MIPFFSGKDHPHCPLKYGLERCQTNTTDPLADARRQQEVGKPRFDRPTGDWDLIHGELVSFTAPLRDLPPIDWLEGFCPSGHSIYQWVMVAVLCGRTLIPTWTYWMLCADYAERVASGNWERF